MPTLKDIPVYPPKILIYGAPGTGKTPFVMSYGEGLQFIDCDGNLGSCRTLKDKFYEDRQKVDIISCLETDPLKAQAWSKFKSLILDITRQCSKKTYPFQALAIDSFTALSDCAVRTIKYNSSILDKPGAMTQAHWGILIDEIDSMMTLIKALPIPVFIIFHDRQDDEGDVTYTRISIFGKNLPAKITSKFDEIVRQRIKVVSGVVKPFLQTMPDAFSIARSGSAIKDGFSTDLGMREYLKQIGWNIPEIVPIPTPPVVK